MLRGILLKSGSSLNAGYNVSSNPTSIQTVRFRRKPRWIPTARSKMFRVPERTIVPEDEKVELLRLNSNYKTQMRAVRAFLREDYMIKSKLSSSDHIILTPEQEDEEFLRIKNANDEWNFEISKIRDARVARENAERKDFIMQRLDLKITREEQERERIEEIVRKEKENSKSFITRENIDEAIEVALSNPVDYNFSIDIDGNVYKGRDTIPDANLTAIRERKPFST